MEAFLEHFITQSVAYSLIAIALVAFLESLALVGLLLPGTVLMAALGALIGSGEVNFYEAWAVGIIGCLLGDWISFWLGWRFKKPLHRWSFLKKHKALLDKTEHALHQHSMFTILVGRFVGPTRPLVPMVAGMLDGSGPGFSGAGGAAVNRRIASRAICRARGCTGWLPAWRPRRPWRCSPFRATR